jgi:hypothetical protein
MDVQYTSTLVYCQKGAHAHIEFANTNCAHREADSGDSVRWIMQMLLLSCVDRRPQDLRNSHAMFKQFRDHTANHLYS